MMTRARVVALVLLVAPACAPPDGEAKAPDPGKKEVVTLRFRDGFVEVRSGADGIRYSALDREGKPLATGLTASELLARYPEHYRAYEEGIAGSPDAPLDASLDFPAMMERRAEPVRQPYAGER
jgi:hypothetical protein